MAQHQAGYFLESIEALFSKKQNAEKLQPLVRSLCFFELKTDKPLETTSQNTVPTIINNLIQRSLPTRPSIFLEDMLANTFSFTRKEISTEGQLNYPISDAEIRDNIFRALHIIEPRKTMQDTDIKKFDDFKTEILHKNLTKIIGGFIPQIVQENFAYNAIIENEKYRFEHHQQANNTLKSDYKADFIITLPYEINKTKGLILETDQNALPVSSDFILLNKKREILDEINYKLIKYKKTEEAKSDQEVQNFSYSEYFDILKRNFDKPLYTREKSCDALQLALTPIGIARIQKTIIEYILAKKLNLTQKVWKIAVIERDIPAAFLAFEDLKKQFENLFEIEGKNLKLPKINLTIYYSEAFEDAKLTSLFMGSKFEISDFNSQKEYDLLIDFSMLSRTHTQDEFIKSAARNQAILRSAFAPKTQRVFKHLKTVPFIEIGNAQIQNPRKEKYNKALNYFARNIFRIDKLNPNQLKTVEQMLCRKKKLVISPPASGKTIAWQLAALLSPGITIAILPNSNLIRSRFDALNQIAPYTSLYINSNNRNANIKKQVLENFANRSTIISFVSIEQFFNENFREIIVQMKNNGTQFSHLIFNEAQCLSEASLCFLPQAKKAAQDIYSLFCKSAVESPNLTAFCGFAGRVVEKDIIQNLELTPNDILNFGSKKFDFETRIIDCTAEIQKNTATEEALIKSAKIKIEKLLKLLETVINDENKKTVIIMPSLEGFYGIIDTSTNSVLNKIKATFPTQEFSVLHSQTNSEGFQDFIENKTKLLITTSKIISLGFNLKEVTTIFFFNMPNSPAQFYSIVSKLKPKNKKPEIYFLSASNKLRFIEFADTEQTTGKSEIMELAGFYPPTEIITRKMLRQKFQGRRKEFTLINEFLFQIRNVQITPAEIIIARVKKEFDFDISIVLQPQTNPYMLSISLNERILGHINYKNGQQVVEKSGFNKTKTLQILAFVHYEVKKFFPTENLIFKTIFKPLLPSQSSGIEKQMETKAYNETFSIEITPENNAKNEIINNLTNFVSEKFTPEIVNKAIKTNYYHLSFLTELNKTARITYVDKNIDLPVRTETLFYANRNKNQTYNTLKYLNIIGVVDDYTTDKTQSKICIKCSKKKDEIYLENLVKYMSNYISHAKADSAKEIITNYTGKTTLQKCLYYLVNFSYEYLADIHFRNCDESGKMLQSLTKNTKESLKKINNFYTYRSHAKYLNPLFTPSLVLETNNLQKSDFNTALTIIRSAGQYTAEREHLLESSEILLKINPENYTLLLTNAYARFWENKDFETAYLRFVNGFDKMQHQNDLSAIEIDNRKETLLTQLFDHSQEVKEKIAPYIKLKSHLTWLQNFNNKFLSR